VIRDDLNVAKSLFKEGTPVIASLAPSYLASFPGTSFESMKEALKKLGFADVEETAIGATIVKKEYDALVDSGKQDIIISTCCHSINLLIEKHYPEVKKYLAPVLSPMLAHAKDIKKRIPNAKVIFLGPCISKKNEIEMYPGYDDCVLTFLELEKWFKEFNIVPALDPKAKVVANSKARLFPTEGGILDTMKKDNSNYTYLAIGGMDKAIAAIKDIMNDKVHHAFIEMSSCEGSCINGPAINNDARALIGSYLAIHHSAGKEDFVVSPYSSTDLAKNFPSFAYKALEPSEKDIEAVLAKIGKTSKKDELNCSSCGYATCREKAKAVLAGKANLEMCLPFLMEKARSFSNSIVSSSDNAIIVLNEDLLIQLANPAMGALVKVPSSSLVGKSVSTILEPDLFAVALGGMPIKNKKIYLSDYGKYLEANITYDPQYHILVGVYRDVTHQEEERQKNKEIATKTAQITTQVIDKNMRAVQEIASLLGESTAETKVALTQLKEALEKEDKND
jgi:PAS domain-containing protein